MNTKYSLVFCALALALGCGGSAPPAQHAHAGGEGHSHGDGHAHGDAHASGEGCAHEEGGGHHEDGHHEGGHHEGSAEAPQPTRVMDDGARLFGAELDAQRAETSLADIVAAPQQYQGQVVKTSGEITQVCQRMGCWMELRPGATGAGIRVPMANHAFFLPGDVAGHRATIQGTVRVEALTAEQRAHLAAEGATAPEVELSIEATGVVVR